MSLIRQILFFLVVGAVAVVGSEGIAGGIALSGLRIATHASTDQISRKSDLLIYAGFKEKARAAAEAARKFKDAASRKAREKARTAAEAARRVKEAAARKARKVKEAAKRKARAAAAAFKRKQEQLSRSRTAERLRDAKEAAARKAATLKAAAKRKADQITRSRTAERLRNAKETVARKAREAKEAITRQSRERARAAEAARRVKEAAARKAAALKTAAKRKADQNTRSRIAERLRNAKETVARKAREAKEAITRQSRERARAAAEALKRKQEQMRAAVEITRKTRDKIRLAAEALRQRQERLSKPVPKNVAKQSTEPATATVSGQTDIPSSKTLTFEPSANAPPSKVYMPDSRLAGTTPIIAQPGTLLQSITEKAKQFENKYKLGQTFIDSAAAAESQLAPKNTPMTVLKGGALTTDLLDAYQTDGKFGLVEEAYEKGFVGAAGKVGTVLFGPVGGALAAGTAQGSYSIGKNIVAPIVAPILGEALSKLDLRFGITSEGRDAKRSQEETKKLQRWADQMKASKKAATITPPSAFYGENPQQVGPGTPYPAGNQSPYSGILNTIQPSPVPTR